jgi:MerR family transcriptional regulator, light-induced transcriptional regulator
MGSPANSVQVGIRLAAQRSGLSAHLIRIWERRYHAVEPSRTETRRRLYGRAQIERLQLLRDLTRAGHSIGTIAGLSTPDLRGLAEGTPGPQAVPRGSFIQECLAAIRAYDARRLEDELHREETRLGLQGLLEKGIAPLAREIGEAWRSGSITATHEHFASAVLRLHLATSTRPFSPSGTEPVVIVATPAGQLHELGAMVAAAAASNLGWRAVYLGAGLPASELAGAAAVNKARAVLLSIVYPADDAALPGELRRLRRLVPKAIPIIAGGRGAGAYSEALDSIGAMQTPDLQALGRVLDTLRQYGIGQDR